MKTRMLVFGVLVLTFALRVSLHAQGTDPLSIVNAWLDALNAGDIDTALSYLSDDAVVTMVPPGTPGDDGIFTGKEEVRGWYEGLVAAKGVATLSDCQVEGESVTCIDTYTDGGLQAMGIDSIEGELALTVSEGRIQEYTFTMSAESLAKFPPPPETLAETGGGAVPTEALVVALGVLAVAGGLGVEMLRRSREPSQLKG
jgi:ketosteroid isomerase-like protein